MLILIKSDLIGAGLKVANDNGHTGRRMIFVFSHHRSVTKKPKQHHFCNNTYGETKMAGANVNKLVRMVEFGFDVAHFSVRPRYFPYRNILERTYKRATTYRNGLGDGDGDRLAGRIKTKADGDRNRNTMDVYKIPEILPRVKLQRVISSTRTTDSQRDEK